MNNVLHRWILRDERGNKKKDGSQTMQSEQSLQKERYEEKREIKLNNCTPFKGKMAY